MINQNSGYLSWENIDYRLQFVYCQAVKQAMAKCDLRNRFQWHCHHQSSRVKREGGRMSVSCQPVEKRKETGCRNNDEETGDGLEDFSISFVESIQIRCRRFSKCVSGV